MKVLVWQWGRFGSGPRFAALLADALRSLPETTAVLSLSSGAELLRSATPPQCDLPVATYNGFAGFFLRVACAPFTVRHLARRIAALQPDVAICVMPAPLDLLMAAALRRLRVAFVVLVHDADAHPGDDLPLLMWLQRRLCAQSTAVGALTAYVGERLQSQGLAGLPSRPLLRLSHPPLTYAIPPTRPPTGDGLRLLSFGRLLPYKGLDLLAEALARLGPHPGLAVRVVGSGPETATLAALRALPGVTVENRWVPEDEIGGLLAWSDAFVLPYHEASQSGVAAVALAAGRRVVATRVGGVAEQLAGNANAILCEPDAISLATGLQSLLLSRHETYNATVDPTAAWREMAASLMGQIEALGLPLSRPGIPPF